jgi:hypothetical protein
LDFVHPAGRRITLAGVVASAIRLIARRDFTDKIVSENRGGHNRDGVGRDRIWAELQDLPGMNEAIVRQQLSALRDSGNYDRIIREEIAPFSRSGCPRRSWSRADRRP